MPPEPGGAWLQLAPGIVSKYWSMPEFPGGAHRTANAPAGNATAAIHPGASAGRASCPPPQAGVRSDHGSDRRPAFDVDGPVDYPVRARADAHDRRPPPGLADLDPHDPGVWRDPPDVRVAVTRADDDERGTGNPRTRAFGDRSGSRGRFATSPRSSGRAPGRRSDTRSPCRSPGATVHRTPARSSARAWSGAPQAGSVASSSTRTRSPTPACGRGGAPGRSARRPRARRVSFHMSAIETSSA